MEYTHKEWLAELESRFGKDNTKWAFVCPACGHVATGQNFKDAGAGPQDMYQTCIGRHTGKGTPTAESKNGCNWAAFGLLGTLGKGDVVVTDDGTKIPVFRMDDKDNDLKKEVI
ncbi:VVA0879 family protein [Desulfitobacterium hafniense]|uniref:VVA0879 family protein n=1 Tax=Desulfitobacterium hafniense TaxID=49338 RepID=UPI00036CCD01|nr:VVA0879 family protein [Desulfitobacterium hafniense]